jgi:hypothetical protein
MMAAARRTDAIFFDLLCTVISSPSTHLTLDSSQNQKATPHPFHSARFAIQSAAMVAQMAFQLRKFHAFFP